MPYYMLTEKIEFPNPDLEKAYTDLFNEGLALSVESFIDEKLAGLLSVVKEVFFLINQVYLHYFSSWGTSIIV